MKLIYLKWADCAFVSDKWKAADDLPDSAAFHLESAGLHIKDTKEGVYLATDYALDDGTWRYTCFVPHVLVIERREYEIR